MAISAGETLSLNNLAGATGDVQNSNVSLGSIKGSPSAGDNITLSSFGIDAVSASLEGYQYAVEGTNETYELGFVERGANFNTHIGNRYQNFTWGVSPAFDSDGDSEGFLSVAANQDRTAVITVGTMNPQYSSGQTSLMSNYSHTLSATFADGFNHHATRYNTAVDKTVYSVDTYDGNSTALCILVDTPVTLIDGSKIEAGDVSEGLKLQGYSFNDLSEDEGNFFNWSSEEKGEVEEEVEVTNVIFSFAEKYYNINEGDIKATSEHPMLVKDNYDGLFKFKQIKNISENDKLVKRIDGVLVESNISSIEVIEETVEIVTIDVESHDTYLINDYVTHNKGGNSHSDLSAPSAPANLAYTEVNGQNHNITWDAVSGITGYRLQVDNNSDFSSPIIDEDEYTATTLNVVTSLGSGTFYARVRSIDHGLNGSYSSALTISR